ncbi:hypothetical protein AU476_07305 [Cupriavidus sp. UYMSc13B]|nr:hypothetical protein AU476_07305 [Cupriavidus sp. UYMSc13B]
MFSIAGNHLTDALKATVQAAAARSPLVVLTHIRVQGAAESGTLTLTGSDGYITAIATVPASVGPDDVDVCVPADKLQAIAGMAAAAIVFSKKDAKVIARAGSCRVTVPTIPGASFPSPNIEGAPIAEFDAPGLTSLIPSVAFAIAGQKVHDKPFLRNLWVESDGASIHVVGCDGFMLAANCLPIECEKFGVTITSEGASLLGAVGAEHFQIYENHVVGSRAASG